MSRPGILVGRGKAGMPKLTPDEIRKRFETSKEFNEIFDAFKHALEQRINNIELYRLLFWNPTLTPDELCLFGEKLSTEFPLLAYDIYMWLANVFEVTYSMYDNYDLALVYYKKAADRKPEAPEPYVNAADCYEPDLNIPPAATLIEFLRKGTETASRPKTLYERLASLYEHSGNDEMSMFYRRKLEEGEPPPEIRPPQQ